MITKNSSILAEEVKLIINRVKKEGNSALGYYARKFDKVTLTPQTMRVKYSDIASSGKKLNPMLRKALEQAAKNVRAFHEAEMRHLPCSWGIRRKQSITGQIYMPVSTAGIYVPGGRFSYPSSVLMSAIPAKVAGVEKVIMVTPPKNIIPAVLYAAFISGVDEIYRIGGPAAIAALAFGTKTIPAVDLIAGPGNAYVNEAKRQVIGTVGIDSLAGPSEVAILADSSVRPDHIAADVMAQAEHDPRAKAYVFSDSVKVLEAAAKLIPAQARKQVTFKRCSLSVAVKEINKIAPEHLEIMFKNPATALKDIKNAGAIFLGSFTPTAVGDYWAGPSHVLPTGGTARFSSGLSAATFLKRTSYASYGFSEIRENGRYIEKLADAEGLVHHKNSIIKRREGV